MAELHKEKNHLVTLHLFLQLFLNDTSYINKSEYRFYYLIIIIIIIIIIINKNRCQKEQI